MSWLIVERKSGQPYAAARTRREAFDIARDYNYMFTGLLKFRVEKV